MPTYQEQVLGRENSLTMPSRTRYQNLNEGRRLTTGGVKQGTNSPSRLMSDASNFPDTAAYSPLPAVIEIIQLILLEPRPRGRKAQLVSAVAQERRGRRGAVQNHGLPWWPPCQKGHFY